MLALNIIFGIVGISSFVFSLYVYFKSESKKVVEAGKNAQNLERIKNTKETLSGLYNTIDMIVQVPKNDKITISQLQHIARIARQQTYTLSKQMEMEEQQLEQWKYGKLFESQINIK